MYACPQFLSTPNPDSATRLSHHGLQLVRIRVLGCRLWSGVEAVSDLGLRGRSGGMVLGLNMSPTPLTHSLLLLLLRLQLLL